MQPCFSKFRRAAGLAVILFSAVAGLAQEDTRLSPGSTVENLAVGSTTYHHVTIRSVSARTVMITHDDGMKSLLLRELSPELQRRFGYNPEADRAEEVKAQAGQTAAVQKEKARETVAARQWAASHASPGKTDLLLRSWGQPPVLAPKVDLRPRFAELGLWAKDQGHRPSCAVFAIVSAMEFQSAEINGNPQLLSEEYLYWATCKTLNRLVPTEDADEVAVPENMHDAGFTLPDVVSALRAYGIPAREKMPNHVAGHKFPLPPQALIDEARSANRTSAHIVPGNDAHARLANIVHALNLGLPVPVAIRFPAARQWRTHYLDRQLASTTTSHAVTLVGYECPTGQIEEAVFRFKNSWGPLWGEAGYGYATYRYLTQNLGMAVVLEVLAR